MQLSKGTLRYISDEFENKISNSSFEEICDKVDLDYDSIPGGAINKKTKLFRFMLNLNNSQKLAEVISVLFLDFSGPYHLTRLNEILKRDGYILTEKGKIISYMGEQVQLATTQSKIEEDLKSLGFTRVSTLLDTGIEEYGKGKEFSSVRVAIIGLITEILKKEKINPTENIKDNMKKLFDIDILKSAPKPLSVDGKKIDMELAHAYGIFSLLSHYLVHYGEISEEEKHFLFFQSIGLVWLLTQRYKKYLRRKEG
jgi:hypothetical protein